MAISDHELALDQALQRIDNECYDGQIDKDWRSFNGYNSGCSLFIEAEREMYWNISSDSLITKFCQPMHHFSGSSQRWTHGNRRGMKEAVLTMQYSRNKLLTQVEFHEILCERLSAVQRERNNMKQHARNIAREQGKPYKVIMSTEWHDAPEAIKYVKFDEGEFDKKATTTTVQLNNETEIHHPLNQTTIYDKTSSSTLDITKMDIISQQTTSTTNNSQLPSGSAREIQEELDISMLSSSASSYVSDSRVGEELLPSSGSSSRGRLHLSKVEMYLENQQRYTSQLSERDAQSQLAATFIINNSIVRHSIWNGYYPSSYSQDDTSFCFTGTDNSEFISFF